MAEQSYPFCFGCGQENPIGLKLKVHKDGDRAVTEFTPGKYHTGFHNIVHGGVLCALMDEVMSYLPHFLGVRAVTGRMDIRFRRPVRSGQKLELAAMVVRQRGGVMEVKAEATFQGEVVVEAQAHLYAERSQNGENSSPD